MRYSHYHGKWYVIDEDFHFEFTLTDLYSKDLELGLAMAERCGVGMKEPIVLTVPKGFVTDLASIPEILQYLGIEPDGPWREAAVLHDLLYQKKSTMSAYADDRFSRLSLHSNKDFADRMFLLGMAHYGVPTFIRLAMHGAVVKYGWGSYADLNTDYDYPLPDCVKFDANRNYIFFRSAREPGVALVGEDPSESLRVNALFANIKRPFINVTI